MSVRWFICFENCLNIELRLFFPPISEMFIFSDPLHSTWTGEVLLSRSVTGLEALHWSSHGNILVTVSTGGSLGFRSRTLGQAQ